MVGQIELVTLSNSGELRPDWALGPQRSASATPQAVAAAIGASEADAILCLDAALPIPSADLLHKLLAGPSDVWHAGDLLGSGSHPALLDHVNPLWMQNAPVDPSIEATSWRLSLRAALMRREVVDQLGGPDPEMDTLTGAGLEFGFRLLRAGALVRHVPALAPGLPAPDPASTDADSVRLIARHDGRRWAGWALQRAATSREVALRDLAHVAKTLRRVTRDRTPTFVNPRPATGRTDRTVAVILPTIERYRYLEVVLRQLAGQTVHPTEVLIVDQTPAADRRTDLHLLEPTLNVQVIVQDRPGQCTARNAAIRASTSEFLLFIDDDDEIEPDLIEQHLVRLGDGIDASCGGVDDATSGPPPAGFQHRRASDVFPTNNTMLRRSVLMRSGLFDPTYDRGPRADHDLGMRLHQSGALLVYDPSVMVFHHHAPAGGLRVHGARTITRASARRSLTTRHLPAPTELYLGMRYFSPRQNREGRMVGLVSVVSGDGGGGRLALRAATQVALLPSSVRELAANRRTAEQLLANRPPIPVLNSPKPGAG